MNFSSFYQRINKLRHLTATRNYRHYSQLRILFFGTDNFSLPSLKLIEKENVHSRLEVVTSFKSKKNPVKEFAHEKEIQVYDWDDIKNNQKFCTEFDIGLVVSFGHLIPKQIIESFAKGMLNVHASLLPKYRGASPIIYAIKNHEAKTGVSIMQIRPQKFDIGDVYAMREFLINDHIKMPELHDKLANMGAELLVECLKNLDRCVPLKQDDSQASYAPKVDKEFCKVRWKEMSALQVYDLHRAIVTYKHVLTNFRKSPVKFLDVSLHSNESTSAAEPGQIRFDWKSKRLLVQCIDKKCVEISKLQVGKKVMTATDFNNGFLKSLPEAERRFE